MEKNKLTNHGYSTRRNKIPKLEDSHEVSKVTNSVPMKKNVESPSAARFCMISGYASPPCRLVTLSQQHENEIVWDLTSPSAMKYQVLLSDKKTSTPNRTPTRSKRELRPRVALCKKNIVLTEDKSGDLVDQLAALNDLVNTEQAQIIMTPPHSVKGRNMDSCELPEDKKKSSVAVSMNTSEIFNDDSFFSESILLSTQAIEEAAIKCPTPSKKSEQIVESIMTPTSTRSFTFAQPSPEGNVSRKSFDLDLDDEPKPLNSVTKEDLSKTGCTKQAIQTLPAPSVTIQRPKVAPTLPHNGFQKPAISNPCQMKHPNTYTNQSITFNHPGNVISKTQLEKENALVNTRQQTSKYPQPLPNSTRNTTNTHASGYQKTMPPKPTNCNNLGIKRLADKPASNSVPQRASAVPPRPVNQQNNTNKLQTVDPFDDDDDELLCAIADEIESQYVVAQSTTCETKLDDEADDGFFQPEVLAYISQIESQAVTVEKSTAVLMEEKRQAAIRKREARLMSRR